MSKNIKIAEKGVDKQFDGVDKVQANKIDHGTQNWVPIDEAWKYADLDKITIDKNGKYTAAEEKCDGFDEVEVDLQFEELSVTENGYYDAEEEGCAGFSQVTVDTSDRLGEVTFNEDGEYSAHSDGYDGYSKVTVAPDNFTSITIEENGTYIAKEENYDGYDEVVVNVPDDIPTGCPSGQLRTGIAASNLRQYDPVVLFPAGLTDPVKVGKVLGKDDYQYWLDNHGLIKGVWKTSAGEKNILSFHLSYYWESISTSSLREGCIDPKVERKGIRGTAFNMPMNNSIDAEIFVLPLFSTRNVNLGDTVHAKYKIMFLDDSDCTIEFDYVYPGDAVINYYNGLISVYYGIEFRYDSQGRWWQKYTIDIYNKDGELVGEGIYDDYVTAGILRFYKIIPLSSSSVAAWWISGQNPTSYYNEVLYNKQVRQNPHALTATQATITVYDGKYYFYDPSSSEVHNTYSIGITDTNSNYANIGAGNKLPNRYGHYAENNEIKDISTGERVYPNVSLSGALMAENDEFIIEGDYVWIKKPGGKIVFTTKYPSVSGAVIGIMKSSCKEGKQGTIITLFK